MTKVILALLLSVAPYRAPEDQWFHEEKGFVTIRDLGATNFSGDPERTNVQMLRLHDDERNVTCWVVSGPARGGISCLPDHTLVGRTTR